ncbi:UBC-like protein [Phlebopus sp. FC_14]|nr:UBC-like protein [Phlebopus sp. FC_14]
MPQTTSLNKNNAGRSSIHHILVEAHPSAAVKRIMQEAKELAHDPCTDYNAAPLEDDIFEWHCTIRGPPGTEFEGGLYHFRIMLPAEYPFRPPSLMMLTPNGRFELNTKICISFTNYHEEEWQPAWGVRTAILGLQGFFPLKGQAANGVGSVEYPVSERRRLALLQVSREWVCPKCQQTNLECLPDPSHQAASTRRPSISEHYGSSSVEAERAQTELVRPLKASDQSMAQEGHQVGTATTEISEAPGVPTALPGHESMAGQDQEGLTSQIAARRYSQALDTPRRPPLLLDTAICVLLVLVVALLCRRIL